MERDNLDHVVLNVPHDTEYTTEGFMDNYSGFEGDLETDTAAQSARATSMATDDVLPESDDIKSRSTSIAPVAPIASTSKVRMLSLNRALRTSV